MAIHGYHTTRTKTPAALAGRFATRGFVSVCVTA
jgi:hypothetical protein